MARQQLAPLCDTYGHKYDEKVCIHCGKAEPQIACYACTALLTLEEAADHFDTCPSLSAEDEFALFVIRRPEQIGVKSARAHQRTRA